MRDESCVDSLLDRDGEGGAAATEVGETVRVAVVLGSGPQSEVRAAGKKLHGAAPLAADIDQGLLCVGIPLHLHVLVTHRLAGSRVDEPDDQPLRAGGSEALL